MKFVVRQAFCLIVKLLFSLAPGNATARYLDHGIFQVAGEIGLVSFGLGKDFNRYSVSGMYGIVPSEVAGGPFVETVALRQTYRFSDWDRMSFYGGINFFHVLGLRYEASRFRDPPRGYYQLGSLRGLLNIGTSVRIRGDTSFYFEAGMNDLWIENWLSNRRRVNPSEFLSLGMGYKKNF